MFIKRILKYLLTKPVLWVVNRFASSPDKKLVHESLSALYARSIDPSNDKKGSLISFNMHEKSVIIFSDQHKGARNGSDDFWAAEKNYLAALDYYNNRNFYYVNLGDSEELWENTIFSVMKYNKDAFKREKLFVDRMACCKIIGNHDLYWNNDPFAQTFIKKMYEQELKIFEGIVLRIRVGEGYIDIFCTHGHQGDKQSDGNFFSKWFVSKIWGPLQTFLGININSPSTNEERKSLHNQMMYEWAIALPGVILVTGHTHQPVFRSLTHLERLYLKLEEAQREKNDDAIAKIVAEIPRRKREYDFVNHSFRNMDPSYFNSGCCCFSDGTITGLEIDAGFIRLVKWSYQDGLPVRIIAEEAALAELASIV